MLALVLTLLQSTAPAPTLEVLAHEAAPIALVRVDTVHAVRSRYRIEPAGPSPVYEGRWRLVECTVERMLLGPPKQTKLAFTVDASDVTTHDLDIGRRAVVFLDQPTVRYIDVKEAPDANEPKPEPIEASTLRAGAIWRVTQRGQREIVVQPEVVTTLPTTWIRVDDELLLSSMLEWLDKEIERTTPTIEAWTESTGVPWHLTLIADRRWSSRAWPTPTIGTLSRDEWQNLWKTFDEAHFFELPAVVGSIGGMEQGFNVIAVRRRDGVQRLWLGSPAAGEDPAVYARARRVWDALPGHEAPAKAR